ncbi:hypothetical protein [Actinomadura mexicana]|uniref:Uncharacterized protein n=1 Tax=Actinomadura mexicana TaxID=134959 RepID=A0A239DRR4_9ACTN|nr:hypothetical protein [Actinomadura mexicana]SNS34442.1 hypothetical protein SAMN06265355_115103 [Actinomadura mexicana]
MSSVTDRQLALRGGVVGLFLGLLCLVSGIASVVANDGNGLNSMNIVLGAVAMVANGVVITIAGSR